MRRGDTRQDDYRGASGSRSNGSEGAPRARSTYHVLGEQDVLEIAQRGVGLEATTAFVPDRLTSGQNWCDSFRLR